MNDLYIRYSEIEFLEDGLINVRDEENSIITINVSNLKREKSYLTITSKGRKIKIIK